MIPIELPCNLPDWILKPVNYAIYCAAVFIVVFGLASALL